jgi:hypothetical protein
VAEPLTEIGEPPCAPTLAACSDARHFPTHAVPADCRAVGCPFSVPRRKRRTRRDTARPNADLIRWRFDALEVSQAEFVTGRGFTLRTFQRALAGVPITKVALRKIAEALALSYDRVIVPSAPRAAPASALSGMPDL